MSPGCQHDHPNYTLLSLWECFKLVPICQIFQWIYEGSSIRSTFQGGKFPSMFKMFKKYIIIQLTVSPMFLWRTQDMTYENILWIWIFRRSTTNSFPQCRRKSQYQTKRELLKIGAPLKAQSYKGGPLFVWKKTCLRKSRDFSYKKRRLKRTRHFHFSKIFTRRFFQDPFAWT